ncbi:MAG: hypothetical protein K0V04_28440 [Deltaproteobacteria bacterium]|nr:hypothetical protein [Deltaproteobacteria bacterium]
MPLPLDLIRTSLTLALAGFLAGLAVVACDLPDRNLGRDPVSGDTDGQQCRPGETRMQECNECICDGGVWACTELACPGSTATVGGTGPAMCTDPAPVDPCNDCQCVDGQWACTEQACSTGTEGDPTSTGLVSTDDGSSGGETCPPEDNPTNGCNECICQAGEWICTEQPCPASPTPTICTGLESADPFTIENAQIMNNELLLTVSYSGGCVKHMFGSCWSGEFEALGPGAATLDIAHEDNNDPCDNIEGAEIVVNLTPIRNAYIAEQQVLTGTIVLTIPTYGTVMYEF